MDKIYRRLTQTGDTPKKKKDEKNRKRNTIVNFRVSPQEKKLIDARIIASGLTRADFFIESCIYQTILVKGNIRTFAAISNRLEEIAKKIDKNPRLEDLEPEDVVMVKTILEIIDRRFGKEQLYGNKNL